MNKKIFDIIDRMLQIFKNSVIDDEYALQLEKEYRKYLEYSIEQLTNKDSAYPINDENLLEEILTKLAQDIINSPIEYKKQFLIEDKNMKKIRRVSNRIYKVAINAKEGKIKGKTIENEKAIEEQLKDLLKQVKPWNREQAKQLVSETILDLGVIQNPSTDILSLRLGHIYESQRNNYEGEEK